jgi:hypothetical protein
MQQEKFEEKVEQNTHPRQRVVVAKPQTEKKFPCFNRHCETVLTGGRVRFCERCSTLRYFTFFLEKMKQNQK